MSVFRWLFLCPFLFNLAPQSMSQLLLNSVFLKFPGYRHNTAKFFARIQHERAGPSFSWSPCSPLKPRTPGLSCLHLYCHSFLPDSPRNDPLCSDYILGLLSPVALLHSSHSRSEGLRITWAVSSEQRLLVSGYWMKTRGHNYFWGLFGRRFIVSLRENTAIQRKGSAVMDTGRRGSSPSFTSSLHAGWPNTPKFCQRFSDQVQTHLWCDGMIY